MTRSVSATGSYWRRRRGDCSRFARRATLGAMLCGPLPAALAATAPAAAQDQDPLAHDAFALDDSDPVGSVPTPEQAMSSPLKMGYFVMLLLERAKAATDRGNHVQAVKYYRALVKALPERATSHAFLCRAYETAGDFAGAIASCKAALGAVGVTIDDNLHFVAVALKKPGKLEPALVADVDAVAAHLEGQIADKARAILLAEQVRCDLALRLDDEKRLVACATRLKSAAPSDARTLAFSLALDLERRDFAAAAKTVEAARRAELPADAVARMEQGIRAAQAAPSPPHRLPSWWVGVGAAVLSLLAAAAAYFTRRTRTRAPSTPSPLLR